MLIWQILAVVLILAFIIIAVLAFIEPGPLHRRSRNPRFREQDAPADEQQGER
jgi:hypothetical protein